MPLTSFDPLIREWFEARFAAVTEPQRLGWPEIRAGNDVLISAPTGAGKTLAAFLTAIDRWCARRARANFRIRLRSLYVSPLKALSNDIHKNLEVPLGGIAALARAQRTSSSRKSAPRSAPATLRASERQRMGRSTPRTFW